VDVGGVSGCWGWVVLCYCMISLRVCFGFMSVVATVVFCECGEVQLVIKMKSLYDDCGAWLYRAMCISHIVTASPSQKS